MKNIFSKCSSLILASLLFVIGGTAHAQAFSVTITVDENGNGRFTNTNGFSSALPGTLAPDPGPGGLAAALTYDLLNPPGLVAGDLMLLEPGSTDLSDIIRYNSSNGTLVFYSDILSGSDSLADTGFPSASYANTLTLTEIGPEGNNGFTYTPTAGQPGFVAGAGGPVTYVIMSDVGGNQIPEPTSLSLVGAAILAMGAGVALRRRT